MPHVVMVRATDLIALLFALCGSKLCPMLVSLLLGHHLAAVNRLFRDGLCE
jgi:hypothetical protein